jgi:hypothetical protein
MKLPGKTKKQKLFWVFLSLTVVILLIINQIVAMLESKEFSLKKGLPTSFGCEDYLSILYKKYPEGTEYSKVREEFRDCQSTHKVDSLGYRAGFREYYEYRFGLFSTFEIIAEYDSLSRLLAYDCE